MSMNSVPPISIQNKKIIYWFSQHHRLRSSEVAQMKLLESRKLFYSFSYSNSRFLKNKCKPDIYFV